MANSVVMASYLSLGVLYTLFQLQYYCQYSHCEFLPVMNSNCRLGISRCRQIKTKYIFRYRMAVISTTRCKNETALHLSEQKRSTKEVKFD